MSAVILRGQSLQVKFQLSYGTLGDVAPGAKLAKHRSEGDSSGPRTGKLSLPQHAMEFVENRFQSKAISFKMNERRLSLVSLTL